MLEAIYVVRHGYRSTWTVDAATGEYSASFPSPTGIPSDPALTGYGEDQSKQLADRILSLHPSVDVIYSSPYYRCLQTIRPVMQRLPTTSKTKKTVRVEYGLSEFCGRAPFEHPNPPSFAALSSHFTFLDPSYRSVASPPPRHGETPIELHNRVAHTLDRIIDTLDADPAAPKVLLICTHAASMIAIGRVLTGYMPEDPNMEDFRCFTCSISKFARRRGYIAAAGGCGGGRQQYSSQSVHAIPPPPLSPLPPLTRAASISESISSNDHNASDNWPNNKNNNNNNHIRRLVMDWQGGNGIKEGWECILNADCSYLSGGEERGWKFTGDEAYICNDDSLSAATGAATNTTTTTITTSIASQRNNSNRRPRIGISIL